MKQENYTLDQNLPGTLHSLFNGSSSYESESFLLFIISVQGMKLHATNFKGLRFFKRSLAAVGGDNFFQEVIHPEDFSLFLHFINSCCEDSTEFQENNICVRVKSPFGYWKKFMFRNRIYHGLGNGEKKYVLTLAKAVNPHKYTNKNTATPNLQVEKSLQESLDRYRVLVNSLDQGFGIVEMIFDLREQPIDYLFTEFNPAFEKLTQLHKPLGKTMKEFFQDHESHWFETFGKVALTSEPVRFEDYAKAHDTWFDVYAFPIGSKSSRKVAFLFSDISVRKRSEEDIRKLNGVLEQKVRRRTKELKENNDLLQMVFDTVNQGIFLLRPLFGENGDVTDFVYVRVNKRVSRYYKEDKMVGKSFLHLNPEATQDGVFEIFKQTILTGESHDFEINFRNNGRRNWFKITTRRQKGLLVNSLENITRKRLRAIKLKENARFKKQLVETSPDIIMIFNLYDEKVKFINRDLSPEMGMTKEKVEGMHLLDIIPLIHPQDREKALDFHKRIQKASDKDTVELEFRLRGQDRLWECHNARAKVFMRNRKGNPYEYILLLRNVQEQKLTQQALVHAEKLSIKGEIARTLAHELRNPLASIGMSAEILDKKLDSPGEKILHNYINIIKRSTKILNNLVSDLLNSSNYSPSKFEKCCLASTTDEALSHAEDRIYLTGIKVVKKYKPPLYIIADKEKLKIALLNIIVNASEAMIPNEGILIVKIEENGENFDMSVVDNGCGIEEHELERLFESFYSQKPNGIGVGLSSVKNILDEHAATVEVKSKPQLGTTFVLSFPRYEIGTGNND